MNVGGVNLKERDEVFYLMKMAFPELPIKLSDSKSDRQTLWIKVFCVAEEYQHIIEDFVLDIQEGFERCLLPNVFPDKGWSNGGSGYGKSQRKRKTKRPYAA